MTLREARELINKLSTHDGIDIMQWDFEKYVNYLYPNYFGVTMNMDGNCNFWEDWTEERFTMLWNEFARWVHSFDK